MKNLKIGIRRLLHNTGITLISSISLAFSFSIVIYIFTYANRELKADNFHEKLDRIFSVGRFKNSVNSPPILAEELLTIPGIESTLRLKQRPKVVIQVGENDPVFSNITFADPSFFQIFTFSIIEGNLENALNEPASIVLTKSEAIRLFGSTNIIGSELELDNEIPLTVNAIIDNYPKNSVFSFKGVVSMSTLSNIDPYSISCGWVCNNFNTIVLLKEGVAAESVDNEVKKLISSMDYEKNNSDPRIIPFKKLYFKQLNFFFMNQGSKKTVVISIIIGIVILIIAIVNYINLFFTTLLQRYRITGIVKIFGVSNQGLFSLFFIETFLICILGWIMSVFIVLLSFRSSVINTILPNSNDLNITSFIFTLCIATALSTVLGFVAILFFRDRSVSELLRNKINSKVGIDRQILIGIQFLIVIVLICSSFFIHRQVNFMLKTDSGFDKENIICLRGYSELKGKKNFFRTELMKKSFVDNVAFSKSIPGTNPNSYYLKPKGLVDPVLVSVVEVSQTYPELYNLTLLEGRYFNEHFETDIGKVILNESAVLELNIDNPLDEYIEIDKIINQETNLGKGKIIGIIPNNHFNSFKTQKQPIIYVCDNVYPLYVSIKLVSGYDNQKMALMEIEKVCKSISPEIPFEWFYLDEHMENIYYEEIVAKKMIIVSSIIAIVIACSGLFSVSVYLVQRRTKELAIRKVHGANTVQLVLMLNSFYIKWIIIALFVSVPITYLIIRKWLTYFASKIDISLDVFIISSCISILIAVLTVSWISYSAASRNPVDSLKYE
ncbi:hypothetical protein ES705_15038 [subsurface metagenome]